MGVPADLGIACRATWQLQPSKLLMNVQRQRYPSKPKDLKLVKLGSVRGSGSRNARSRVGRAIGSGSHPVLTSKYLTAVATEG